ncbi:FMN-binding negative transcriptional regulator [Microbacterium sp. NPDC008134]|uniref:FMN-binding negative transcriptional regulator n=1 Tax=Microbacterium sp. NPDC008134 TaxID=3364183 RepID=UPI0036EAE480
MRHNPDYALDDVETVRALVRENPWATIVSHVPGEGLVASHYPVLLEEDAEGISIVSHVGRPDERLHQLGQHEAMVIIYGPQGYVSPSWYGTSPAVPTWDFAVAHLFGTPEILSDDENLAVLDRLVSWFESPLPDPFLMRRTLENTAYAERIVHGTVGFRLRATRFEAKEKMHQDKSPEVIARVIDALRHPGPYENPKLADRIADVNRDVLDGKEVTA